MNGGMRMARTRTKGVGGNVAVVTSTKTVDAGTADGSGIIYGYFTLDPMNTSVVTQPVVGIAGSYEFYRIRKVNVQVVPTGGSQAAGSLQHCFVGNSEAMVSYVAGSNLTRSNIITNEEKAETVTLQGVSQKTFDNSRVTSRQWYAVNSTLAATADDFDRTIQAFYAYNTRGTTPSVAVNLKLVFNITYELRGLGYVAPVTLQRAISDGAWDGYRIPFHPEDGVWPDYIELYDRTLGSRRYDLKDEPSP